MPVRQGDPFKQAAVSTAFRQPTGHFRQAFRRNFHAGGHLFKTLRVAGTMRCLFVHQRTHDGGVKNFIGVLILHFVKTAKGAAVTEQFPFIIRQKALNIRQSCSPDNKMSKYFRNVSGSSVVISLNISSLFTSIRDR